MSLEVRWSIPCRPISLAEASHRTGVSLIALKQLYRDGVFGPPPSAVRDVSMYEVAVMFAVKAADSLKIAREHLLPMLPSIAGATYVQYQLTEIAEGRCNPLRNGGTPDLNIQLCTRLRSPAARSDLEARLPGGPIETRRYVCFDDKNSFVCDDLGEIEQSLEGLRTIDTWDLARMMKEALKSERLYMHIA